MRGGEVLCGIVSGKLWEQHTDGSGACGKSIAQRSGSPGEKEGLPDLHQV